jgi:predicted ATPase
VLQLSGEQEFPVPPLALPDRRRPSAAEDLTRFDAVALFVARARAVMPDVELTGVTVCTVAEICVRLEGLPLAIELAAARSRVLPPEALLARLSRRFALLTGGPHDLPARQRTLRSTIDWSYSLLDAGEQRLVQRLAVFVGGWSLPAAEAICGASGVPVLASGHAPPLDLLDGLESLVRKSLVRPAAPAAGMPRFTMLETIREYAEEQLLASGAEDAMRREHARYFVMLAETAEDALSGPEEGCWLEQLAAEHDNCRAALAWCFAAAPEQADVCELGLRLAAALFPFWSRHGDWSEGRRWLARALSATGELHAASGRGGVARQARAKALLASGTLAWWQGEYRTALPVLQESECLYRELGDMAGVAGALNARGGVLLAQGDPSAARALFEQALALGRQVEHAESQTFALT